MSEEKWSGEEKIGKMDENRQSCLTKARKILPKAMKSTEEIRTLMNILYSKGVITDDLFLEIEALVMLAMFCQWLFQ